MTRKVKRKPEGAQEGGQLSGSRWQGRRQPTGWKKEGGAPREHGLWARLVVDRGRKAGGKGQVAAIRQAARDEVGPAGHRDTAPPGRRWAEGNAVRPGCPRAAPQTHAPVGGAGSPAPEQQGVSYQHPCALQESVRGEASRHVNVSAEVSPQGSPTPSGAARALTATAGDASRTKGRELGGACEW